MLSSLSKHFGSKQLGLLNVSRFAFMNQNEQPPVVDMDLTNSILDMDLDVESIQMKGRNSRKPKKSNHGARPCSSYMRKLKQKGWYHILRGEWFITIKLKILIKSETLFNQNLRLSFKMHHALLGCNHSDSLLGFSSSFGVNPSFCKLFESVGSFPFYFMFFWVFEPSMVVVALLFLVRGVFNDMLTVEQSFNVLFKKRPLAWMAGEYERARSV